ncbi:MAG: bifunctional phosphopantothenoylcysteine decarboxylase/phosphopantothenate--cysteine ligase CoaBC [Acidobacteriota bacterium]|nr:bifunctional phosphopantothenoylcysteine decarboxylase/phosphopantothenate--cysteine ligase CoaBC [Acidobacteriota bacterium]
MKIVLAVGGGIAAYKAAELARLLIRRGDQVQVVMTVAAREFVQPLTFATLTGNRVLTDLFEGSAYIEHIEAARKHELLLIAPATAGILAKLAHGLADDFLSTLYLAFTGQVVLAPSMNDDMWRHPATRQNLAILQQRGARVISPETGYLACGTVGPGRLAAPEVIVAALEINRDLAGEIVLITAGPTQEAIDSVRFLSNRSSGKMGYALAAEAASRGASVVLISGPVPLDAPVGVERIMVRTTAQMREAVMTHLERATIIVKCAAVADYRVANPAGRKLKKTAARLSLELEPTEDILAEVGRIKGNRLLIGFAAETEDLRTEARRKLESKNCDMVVANLVGGEDTGFEADSNEVTLALRSGEFIELPRGTKREVARLIFDQIANLIPAHRMQHAS